MAKQTSSPKTSDVEVAKAIKAHNLNRCSCGCNAFIKGTYKQGHDARHVSTLKTLVLSGGIAADDAIDSLGSVALRAKLAKAIANAKPAKDARPADVADCDRCGFLAPAGELLHDERTGQSICDHCASQPTEIKVGRWWYPIVGAAETGVQYEARDGSIKVASANAKVR